MAQNAYNNKMNFDIEESLLDQWKSFDTYQVPALSFTRRDSLDALDSVYEMQNYFRPIIIDHSEHFRNRVISFEGHTDLVRCVSFSYDGKFLATGSNDHSIKVWNISEKSLCYQLDGHTSNVKCICFSPEGLRLFSAGEDKHIKF
jgi:WD40 repeat protein